MTISFSVITPCLNAEKTIERTIKSVISQNYPNLEYIIIDGGSTDNTLKILNRYKPFIKHLISEEDSGISEAFNKGLKLSTGEYIGILNSDDYYEPAILDKIANFIANHQSPDIIHSKMRYVGGETEDHIVSPDIARIRDFMSIFHPTMLVRKSVYNEVGPYNQHFKYAMDSEWTHRAVQANKRFLEYPEVIANMSLMGVSHRNLSLSLREFRRSAISHGARPIRANYFFLRQLFVQSLLKIKPVKQIVLAKNNQKAQL